MFIEVPRGKTAEELYDWCVKLAEKINRELSTQNNDKEKEEKK